MTVQILNDADRAVLERELPKPENEPALVRLIDGLYDIARSHCLPAPRMLDGENH